jgi:hypothetical protein
VIVVALVAACLLVGKAIETPHSRRKFDGAGAAKQRLPATPTEPITAQTRPVTKPHRRPTELVDGDTVDGGHIKDPEDDPLVDSLPDRGWGFSEREEEEFLLIHGPHKVRKAINERRKAREQAKKPSN